MKKRQSSTRIVRVRPKAKGLKRAKPPLSSALHELQKRCAILETAVFAIEERDKQRNLANDENIKALWNHMESQNRIERARAIESDHAGKAAPGTLEAFWEMETETLPDKRGLDAGEMYRQRAEEVGLEVGTACCGGDENRSPK